MNCKYIAALIFLCFAWAKSVAADENAVPVRVFIFAGQSNMVGSDSKVQDIKRFPPFAGLEAPQTKVMFSYCIGREDKMRSDGWVDLQPVDNVVGPELSFARKVSQNGPGPIAIIKCAAGGTHLGGDWNPDDPSGFKMYPLMIDLVQKSLQDLEKQGIQYRLEGFMWHQGENDMFEKDYLSNYGKNLNNFMACVRRDLVAPKLNFYVGELCTKTIWGMDLRPRMYQISLGQKQAVAQDSLAQYVRTSQVGVEIGGGVGLHYHYGTLGQLQHGVNYADAYLKSIQKLVQPQRKLSTWPYPKGSQVKLFIMAGHRNMEGERAFVQELAVLPGGNHLLKDDPTVAFKYSLGGDYQVSHGWEPLGVTGYYDTFGPELSFAAAVKKSSDMPIAIAKYTHSGSQIIDWTPEGSEAKSRNLYPAFVEFSKQAIQELEAKGHQVQVAGVFYHLGENDMSFGPYREDAAKRVQALIKSFRSELKLPDLNWFVSQQPPTKAEGLDQIDVVAKISELANIDPNFHHIKTFDLPQQPKQLVINTEGIVVLGRLLAAGYLESEQK